MSKLAHFANSLVVILIYLGFTTPSPAEVIAEECINAWESSQNPVLSCELQYEMTPAEKTDINRKTSGVIQSISCTSMIRVDKEEAFSALLDEEEVALDPHEIVCVMKTNRDVVNLALTVAPAFRIVNGRVIRANINLSSVEGMPSFLSRMLREYANGEESSESLRLSLQDSLDKLSL